MKATQTERILHYMEQYGSITALDAMREFRCMRLAARIADLKKAGVKIVKSMVTTTNSFGENVRFAKYELEDGYELGNRKEAYE